MKMNYLMEPYDESLKEILKKGTPRTNQRTGTKTLSVFGMQTRYRLDTERFPIITKRKVWPKSVFGELLWFISGSTNNETLKKFGCSFWDPWVDEKFETDHGFAAGSFGPVYGFQLRHFGGYYGNGVGKVDGDQSDQYGSGGFDQLDWLINRIKEDYSCRRTLWSLWNPQDVKDMRLPPCHYGYQVLVDDDRRLTGIMTQRSCDYPIGCPANIQFYSALTIMIAQQTNCIPHEFVHTTHDSHIYKSQIEAVEEYLSRNIVESPKLEINHSKDIFSYKLEDFIITDYNPLTKIDMPVVV
jgi:thymidylate synthase